MKTYLIFGILILLTACRSTSPKNSETIHLDDTIRVENAEVFFENDTLTIFKIDSIEFFKHKSLNPLEQDTLTYIADFGKAKKQLAGRVGFGEYDMDLDIVDTNKVGQQVAYVRLANGDTLTAKDNQEFGFIGYVKYYPEEDILLLEGGHTSDYVIDLKTGSSNIDTIGNPMYIFPSKDKKFRLNGWFPGQECSEYFIQQRNGSRYTYLAKIPLSISNEGFDFCTLIDMYWTASNELYFRNNFFGANDDPRVGFFKLILKK